MNYVQPSVSQRSRFRWTEFYEAVANELLKYRSNRTPLIEGIHDIASRGVHNLAYLNDKFADGSTGPLKDICPFTAIGTFNRQMTAAHRKTIAAELAKLIGVDIAVPETFEGIPVLPPLNSWFFGYSIKRLEGDIDALWAVFAAGAHYVDSDRPDVRDEFVRRYDDATMRRRYLE